MSVDYTATATPPAAVIPPAVGTIHNFTVTNGGTVTGAAPLAWTAYYSADAFFGTEDSIFDSGTAAASLFDPDETITVNWPATAPTGYQILRFESPDDPGTPATAVSGLITRGVVDVDYGPLTAPAGGTVTVGTALSGVNFAVENTGSDPGSVPIEWTAWISSDATPGNSGDVQVDSGSIGALGAAPDNSGSVSVTGNWSVPVGDYWLIVTWNAADDGNSGNDSVTSALQYQVQTTDVDYEADTPPDGGNALLAGSATAISETFTLQNSGSAAGSQTLSWIAWMSEGDAVLNAGDYQIDSGTVVPLPGPLASTAPISIGGFWPDDPGSYDIILTWNALDDNDTSNDSMTTAASTTVSLPSTDYTVSVPAPGGTVQAGGAVSGSITVQNTGPDDDPAGGFNWSVYASTDTAYNSGDALIDSGIGAPMDVLDPPAGIPYAGTWPDIGGDYHIVAVIDAMYDANTANDEAYDVSGPTAVINATDYTIENVQYHPLGVPGDVVANRPTPPAHPAALDFRFNIRETNGIEGSRKVDYVVHASTDTILDGGDIDLKADFVKANDVGAGGTFTVDFTDAGAWPAFPQPYYLIITINAADDVDPANDIFVAGPVQVAVFGSDTEPNDDVGPFDTGPPVNLPTSFSDLSGDLPTGELRPDELVRIDGVTDGPGGYDTYGFIAGTGMTSVDLKLTWNTGSNTADMFLWNELNGEAESIEVTADLEEMTVISLTPGDWYYIGVQQLAGPAADYALTITGRP